MTKCKLCGKLLLHKILSVEVYSPRMMMLGEDKLVVSFLERSGAADMYADTAIMLCRGCWSKRLRPFLVEEVDKEIAVIAAGEGAKVADKNILGDLVGEY
jgi:hypothetical protein